MLYNSRRTALRRLQMPLSLSNKVVHLNYKFGHEVSQHHTTVFSCQAAISGCQATNMSMYEDRNGTGYLTPIQICRAVDYYQAIQINWHLPSRPQVQIFAQTSSLQPHNTSQSIYLSGLLQAILYDWHTLGTWKEDPTLREEDKIKPLPYTALSNLLLQVHVQSSPWPMT